MTVNEANLLRKLRGPWWAAVTVGLLSTGVLATPGAEDPVLGVRSLPVLQVDGHQFKDHNRNGMLDPYEDWRLPPETRARDLVAKMNLPEKAGALMHANPPSTASTTIPGAGTAWEAPGIRRLLIDQHITSFLNRLNTDVASMAEQSNALQAIAETARLGIPVMLSTDPRSQFQSSQGISVSSGRFSQWPDPVGMAAVGDPALLRAFADSVRQEYLAVGIRMALSPQADLTRNPRWHRVNGTFGSDPEKAKELVQAYVQGMQVGPDGLHRDSVVAVVKHWVGYGATGPEGYDSHNFYGRFMGVDSNTIEEHLRPFEGAFAARAGAVMPTYGQPLPGLRVKGIAQPVESVGVGFNKQMLTELLRGRFGFTGLVLSDWQITDDCNAGCREGAPPGQKPSPQDIAMPWGVESLTKEERFARALDAGVDQFGGSKDPEHLIHAVQTGRLVPAALDGPVYRVLLQKFQLGLFENPYVDVARAADVVGSQAFQTLALEAQHRSVVLLKNKAGILPLQTQRALKVHLYQLDAGEWRQRGFEVVGRPEDADVAVMALNTPSELLHGQHFFGSRYREGSTAFKAGSPDYEAFRDISSKVPTVVSVYLSRPADLTLLAPKAAAIVGHFGIGAPALLDVLTGRFSPTGRLPFDLPMQADDSLGLVTRLGDGLGY